MTNPTWYDILGVDRGASAAEIKAAWRDATDKFEPGSGQSQFRLFNEAADVLLDPDKRAAYDAELGGTTAPGGGAPPGGAPPRSRWRPSRRRSRRLSRYLSRPLSRLQGRLPGRLPGRRLH